MAVEQVARAVGEVAVIYLPSSLLVSRDVLTRFFPELMLLVHEVVGLLQLSVALVVSLF
jgi:hypothetical protein